MSFQFLLNNDIVRKHNFCYEDSEIMNALFDEEECSSVQMPPKLMSQLLDHIHRSPEILVTVLPNRFTVRSQHKPEMLLEADLQKSVMSTGLTISVSEFQKYQYQSLRGSEAMIFVVKEVRTTNLLNNYPREKINSSYAVSCICWILRSIGFFIVQFLFFHWWKVMLIRFLSLLSTYSFPCSQ